MSHPRQPFSVGTLLADPGTRSWGYCAVELDAQPARLPIVVVHGSRPGPILGITAGIHGGECVSMVAVRNFLFDLDPSVLRGTVIASLQSNPYAFKTRTAFINPMDGKNLNRAFPGDADGSSTDQLAAWLWSNIIARSDYYVDCHSGDIPEVLEHFAGVSLVGSLRVRDVSREMANQFDVERIVVLETEGSAIHAAASDGIPSVLIEVGAEGRWTPEEVAVQQEGLSRIAKFAGLLDAGREERKSLPVFEATASVLSEHSGLWYRKFAPGSIVDAGTLLGTIQDPFGTILQEARAPVTGVILYGLSSLAANEGDLIACIAGP